MTRILAAIDDSETAPAVLATATVLAGLDAATVEALNVRDDGYEPMRAEARASGVPLQQVAGDPLERIVEAASAADVVALVVGARRQPDPLRPIGHVTLALLTAIAVPLVVVPPTVGTAVKLRRMLVPLDGTMRTAERSRAAIDIANTAGIEAIVVHVCDENRVPMFTDQPQHETRAFADEFLERYAPGTQASLELRVGQPADEVLSAAESLGVDLIAIAWAQILTHSHGQLVRELLARTHVPLLFLPLSVPDQSRNPQPIAS